MKILHLADVHLDRPFVSAGRQEGQRGRARLRRSFQRCLEIAGARGVDLVTIGGDLWEEEHVRADTREFVAYELGKLRLPTLIICGNHDPYLPGGNHARTRWPDNVHVFTTAQPTEYQLGDLSVWGVSWIGGRLDARFLESFRAPDDGRAHLLLLHGTARGVPFADEADNYCVFTPDRVRDSGFLLCLCGHIHGASYREPVVYPGSPEPLGWGEMRRHCAALVETGAGGATVELIDVAQHRYVERPVDCANCSSSGEISDRLAASLNDGDRESVHLRVLLQGEVDAKCEVRPTELAASQGGSYAELIIIDATTPAYDLDALASQPTARGFFVRKLREKLEQADEERQRRILEVALMAGLRALDGRKDVVNVD
jgi:DNA repair protein SbcD/Mre11